MLAQIEAEFGDAQSRPVKPFVKSGGAVPPPPGACCVVLCVRREQRGHFRIDNGRLECLACLRTCYAASVLVSALFVERACRPALLLMRVQSPSQQPAPWQARPRNWPSSPRTTLQSPK